MQIGQCDMLVSETHGSIVLKKGSRRKRFVFQKSDLVATECRASKASLAIERRIWLPRRHSVSMNGPHLGPCIRPVGFTANISPLAEASKHDSLFLFPIARSKLKHIQYRHTIDRKICLQTHTLFHYG